MPTISQAAADTPLELVRGDDFSFQFRIADPETPGNYRDLSGVTALAQVRESTDAETVLAEFTISDYSNGATDRGLELSLGAADTALFPYRAYWDLQITEDSATRTYLSGEVLTARDVSR